MRSIFGNPRALEAGYAVAGWQLVIGFFRSVSPALQTSSSIVSKFRVAALLSIGRGSATGFLTQAPGPIFIGNTANQRRQFTFLEQLLSTLGSQTVVHVAEPKSTHRSIARSLGYGIVWKCIQGSDGGLKNLSEWVLLTKYLSFFAGTLESLRLCGKEVPFVVLANDHSARYVAVLQACRALKVPTIYLQHASVTEDFPSLNRFDIAVLSDEQSRSKYARKGKLAEQVYVIPRPNPFESALSRSPGSDIAKRKEPSIGIFLSNSRILSIPRVLALVESIKKRKLAERVSLFPHPADAGRTLHPALDGLLQPSRDTLPDCLIVGNSGVIVELTQLAGPIYYDSLLDEAGYDYYRVLPNERIEELPKDGLNFLRPRPWQLAEANRRTDLKNEVISFIDALEKLKKSWK